MKLLLYLVGLIVLLTLGGCIHYPRTEIGFWDQHVLTTIWGFGWVTPYGPINIGYMTWERNIENPIPPVPPSLPIVPGALTLPVTPKATVP